MKKIILVIFCLALSAACFPSVAHCNDEAIYEDDASGYLSIVFELDDEDKVWRMKFRNFVD